MRFNLYQENPHAKHLRKTSPEQDVVVLLRWRH